MPQQEPTFRKLGQAPEVREEQRFGTAPAHLQYSTRKPKGYVELIDPILGSQSGETLMCVHCQFHWVVQPGSGMKRGFCLRCNGPTCGKQACEEQCVPFEKAIEQMEARGRLQRELEKVLS